MFWLAGLLGLAVLGGAALANFLSDDDDPLTMDGADPDSAGDGTTAGEGADDIVLGDWIAGQAPAELTDFDPAEDRIMVVWDTVADPDPEIEVATDPLTPGLSRILVNGTELARVQGGGTLRAEDILLVDYADAPGAPRAGA